MYLFYFMSMGILPEYMYVHRVCASRHVSHQGSAGTEPRCTARSVLLTSEPALRLRLQHFFNTVRTLTLRIPPSPSPTSLIVPPLLFLSQNL